MMPPIPWPLLYFLYSIAFVFGSAVLVGSGLSLYDLIAERKNPETESEFDSEKNVPLHRPLLRGFKAGLEHELCGNNETHLSRVPHSFRRPSSWSPTGSDRLRWLTLLGVMHARPISPSKSKRDCAEIELACCWPEDLICSLRYQSQTIGESKPCIPISRATLMTLFAMTNARPVFSYSSASGHRSAYPSYCGQWSITWPMGRPCFVSFAAHDSHTAATDVYPPSFAVRLDKCVEMLAGVVTDGAGWKLAFPGRMKKRGSWVLRERKRGLAGAHGQRHLWNMVGGKVYEVDLLVLEPFTDHESKEVVRLRVPTRNGMSDDLVVGKHEQNLLARALACLPWTSLSWSMHWGMRDILLAYGKVTMDRYRSQLAAVVKEKVKYIETALVEKGWDADFVRDSMGDLAESAILSGGGNSGDLVRVVVAIVKCLVDASDVGTLFHRDMTDFWLETIRAESHDLEVDTIVALTKFFVLEWSQELDYQLYHELPVELYLA